MARNRCVRAGLVIPVYLSTIDSGNGSITDRNFEAAQIHLDDMGMCGYNKAITARVIKDGVAYPLVSQGGPSGCPCIPGADMTVGATTLKGAKHPCPQSCADTSIFHPVEGDPGAGQQKGTKGKGEGGWSNTTRHPHGSFPSRHPSLPAPLPAPLPLARDWHPYPYLTLIWGSAKLVVFDVLERAIF